MTEKEGDGVPTIESLTEQVDNLNKGVAKYRDEASSSKKEAEAARQEAKAAREEAASVKAAIEGAKDDEKEVKLSPDDEKKLDAWAKKQGYATKAEVESERQRMFGENLKQVEAQAVNEFLEKHPELNKDEEWKKIADQFALYKQPTNITGYRQILTKVYKEVFGNEDAAAKARAAIENRKRLALGGGNQKADNEDAMIDDYAERYPNLSREQIADRLQEINELAQARAKKKAASKK